MTRSFVSLVAAVLSVASCAVAQTPQLSKAVQSFVSVDAPRIVLSHVRVIDGTGKPAVEDQNVVIENGKIAAINKGSDVKETAGTKVVDLRGHSVLPGIVGMHNHLFYIARPNLDREWHYDDPVLVPQMSFSSPRLYLAAGVTTMRTTGSVETYADLNLKKDIDSGKIPGPHLDVTGPYLEGANSLFVQMPQLKNADDTRQTVEYWADRGVTSFKAYMNITRAGLKAAIDAAHKRGLKITGHLCSVTYKEAAELGIDDLEHGFFVNTQLDPGKKPDQCSESAGMYTLEHMTVNSPEAKDLIDTLVKHKVAITSTLPVFERFERQVEIPQGALDVMSPQAKSSYEIFRHRPASRPAPKEDRAMLFKRGMELERAFVAAGGLLIAGPDPTGAGDVVPGFGDHRGIELLVRAGFTPVEAIKIATFNGAVYMGREKQIGSIEAGKNADLFVVRGDPSQQISDIENVAIVFKDGVGYDSQKLRESVKGRYGEY